MNLQPFVLHFGELRRSLPTRNDPRGMLLAGFAIGWASAGCLVLPAMRLT